MDGMVLNRSERRAAERKVKGGSPHMKTALERGVAPGKDLYAVLKNFDKYSKESQRLREGRDDDTDEPS